jgi:uncharacterized protein
MPFEFDPEKSAANSEKHGIDFIQAQEIWAGRIGDHTWSAFITYRNEKIRIISVRRARADEEARYLAD